MKTIKVLVSVLLAIAVTASQAFALSMNGAGATFPFPIYSKWFFEYNKQTGVKINYQSIGSGGGVRQVIAKTVDFGASDAPMTPEEMQKAGGAILHIPTVLGSVAVAYNPEGLPAGLKFTPEVLVSIFMGEITQWNDPVLVALNPGAKLPDKNITVAHRSDGSGTTAIFADYLAKVSPKWASQVGSGKALKWPAGVGGKGNEGVAGLVKQIPGAIGYMELGYAVKNNLPSARIKNRAGNFVEASLKGTTAAAKGALKNIPPDFRVSITDAPGAETYPIVGFTWLLLYPQYGSEKGAALVKFLEWALVEGQGMAEPLYYAPLPSSLVEQVKAKVKTIKY